MSKTRQDVIARALRIIGVTDVAEPPNADDANFAYEALDACFSELIEAHGLEISWGAESTPDGAFLPLADMVAAEIASTYGPQSMQRAPSKARAITRLRAYLYEETREMPWTDEERDERKRAQFF